jgi:hypothetical protein
MIDSALGVSSTIADQIHVSYEIGTTGILAIVALLALAGIITALSVIASTDYDRG